MPVSDECFDCLISRVIHSCVLAGREDDAPRVAAICTARLAELRDIPVPQPVVASELHRIAVRELRRARPLCRSQGGEHRHRPGCVPGRPSSPGDLSRLRDRLDHREHLRPRGEGARDRQPTLPAFFDEEFDRGLAIDDCDEIEEHIGRVVYITDNCGEIVLDRLLIGHLVDRGARVTVAVRDGPILNDATLEDARALGLDRVAECLTTTGGGSEIGVPLDRIPPALADAIDRADLIIAKGMANYESLSEYRRIFRPWPTCSRPSAGPSRHVSASRSARRRPCSGA